MRIAYWGDLTWALGRIGRAIQKYASVPVDLYDWSKDTHALFWERWRDYDVIIVTTIFQDLNMVENPELNKRLLIISHFPTLEHPQFRETTCIRDGAKYGGVSIETCEEMERHGMQPAHWIPFGVDTDIFRIWHTVTGPIRRIGVIGNPNSNEPYVENKGLKEFAVLCERLGVEPVYIYGREGDADLYKGIDLLVCMSRLEAGPLGIFEAAACGIPVLTRPVGNAQRIKGIEMFDTVDEAVLKIQDWNQDRDALREYTRRITDEVRANWSMASLVQRLMVYLCPENISQLNADRWVLSLFRKPGYFVDVGCGDAEKISNSYLLEKSGWKGICIDAFPRNFKNRPNSIVVQAVVYSEKDKEMSFILTRDEPDFSGIRDELDRHKERVLSQIEREMTVKTRLLEDILAENNAPSYIEYMNLDIEGAEYEVLRTFPFHKYTFGCLTVEHNYEEPKRTLVTELLENNGYKLAKTVEWDDWFIRRSEEQY